MVVFKHHLENFHVDGESSDLEKNVGEESKVFLITVPGIRMANKTLNTPDNNSGVQRSTRVNYLVQRFTYDCFILNDIITHTW
jgi:hypothetical protein